jgi:hypothetical protein
MKRITLQFLIVVMVVGLLSSTAFAWLHWPGAMKGKGRWAVDASWIHQEFDVRGCEFWQRFIEGDSWDLVDYGYYCIYIEDLESDIFLVSLEYGVCDMFDLGLLLGVCDVEGKFSWPGEESFTDTYDPIDGSSGVVIGVAGRGTFCQWDSIGPSGSSGPGGTLSLGWNGQALYCNPGETTRTYVTGEDSEIDTWKVDLDWYQARCMVGLGYQRDQLGLYTNVGYQSVCGDFSWSWEESSGGEPIERQTGDGKFRQETCFVFEAGGWYQVNDDLHIGGGAVLGEDLTVYYISGQYKFR